MVWGLVENGRKEGVILSQICHPSQRRTWQLGGMFSFKSSVSFCVHVDICKGVILLLQMYSGKGGGGRIDLLCLQISSTIIKKSGKHI